MKHTIFTSDIYEKLENKMLTSPFYGVEFPIESSPSGQTQPDLTNIVINKINSGVGMVNYIGHGSSENLAHELILKMDRDLDLINTNNKPPIWVVGTCSFGRYFDETCMAEELLKKNDAAIAIVATTEGIPVSANSLYLSKFYTLLNNYISDDNNYRLGKIYKEAKESNITPCYQYTFQLFGDPALTLNISKETNNIFNNIDIDIGSENQINTNISGLSHIEVQGETITKTIIKDDFTSEFECDFGLGEWESNECVFYYKKSGPTLFESSYYNNINFFVPLETNEDQSGKIIIFNEDSFTSQFEETNFNLNINEDLFDDNLGPTIKIYNNDIELSNNSFIHFPYNFTFSFEDDHPINLSGINDHYLRFWINDDEKNSIILNHYFNSISTESGIAEIIIDESEFIDQTYILNVEAWDILNNQSKIRYYVNTNKLDENIFNVYNFPNPFNEKTFFTFQVKNPEPIIIDIKIYSKTGKQINSINYTSYDIKSYHVIPPSGWFGQDKSNVTLKNGTYFYSLEIISYNNKIVLYKDIHNMTILK